MVSLPPSATASPFALGAPGRVVRVPHERARTANRWIRAESECFARG